MGVGMTSLFAGGMLNDVNAEIVAAKYAEWAYPNTTTGPNPCALVTFKVEGVDEPKEEAYTLGGKTTDWKFASDGKMVDSLRVKPGMEAGFSEKSKWGLFLKHMLKALKEQKLPIDWATDDITTLVGLKIHLIQIPSGGKGPDGQERTMAVPDEIISLPGKSGSTSTPSNGADTKAVEVITGILLEAGDSGVTKSSLAGKIFTAMKSDPLKNAVAGLAIKDDFLNKHFKLSGGIVKLQ